MATPGFAPLASDAIVPAQISCGNTFLNTVCPPFVRLAQISCWWAFWNGAVRDNCIRAHIIATAPWCYDCRY